MYYERLIEEQIALKLKTSGAVVVAGPKFCGKTTTCMLYQKSFVKLNTKQAIAMARMNPKAVLVGENPRLIDEWQKAPSFLLVLTAVGGAYKREDGVFVAPINLLRP